MNLRQLLDVLKNEDMIKRNVTAWHVMPKRPARYAPFPEGIDPRLIEALGARGLRQLYTHQKQAVESVVAGDDVVIVTPTASGKTLCYNLSVLNRILGDPSARALYLFPTKALASDQLTELLELADALDADIKAYTYDGDTPSTARRAVRQAGHIVVTNPDMLHANILPGHTNWVKLFENLQYVVIDEIHAYTGVFGSHLANIVRRLKRLCAFYGSDPVFICCSATIANPGELASRLIGRPVRVVDDNGAPASEKHFLFYNPPVVNRQLGIRRSALFEARTLASRLILNNIQTIVFTRSRLNVEVLTTYLKKNVRDALGKSDAVRAYRGGFLPGLRREIERGLRSGAILGVVSTNALEMGIDIGRLQASVLCGYPGTIASTWQQAGRAGRRDDVALSVLIATSAPLDQYIIRHPEYFFNQPPEMGLLNPDNLYILISHIKCASFELPFVDDELFGGQPIAEILEFLEESQVLRHVAGKWHWMTDEFPASGMSLRSASNEDFTIIDTTGSDPVVIGEMDRYSVPMLLHEEAIYIHQGQQYQVEKLDYPNKKAFVRKVDIDYYTDADMAVDLKVLDIMRARDEHASQAVGEVLLSCMVSLFKKIKLDTHENIGSGPVRLPQLDMHTTAFWFTLPEALEGVPAQAIQGAMVGIRNVLSVVAPLYLMCSSRDLTIVCQSRSHYTARPTIFICDALPGGVGFSEKLYEMHGQLLKAARELIAACSCADGCPSCVGPSLEVGELGKEVALRLLEEMISVEDAQGQD